MKIWNYLSLVGGILVGVVLYQVLLHLAPHLVGR